MSEFKDKFIGFVDIIGFGSLVRASESGSGVTPAQLLEATTALGEETKRGSFTLCPQAPSMSKGLDFQLTQISDCVVVSTEVSPAGLINLISHCFGAHLKLLRLGLMCRGYVRRGSILHTERQVIGSGYMDALDRERQVSIFKQTAEERGTPFIEIDREVVKYAQQCDDRCVNEMFSRMVKTEGDLAAIFPFQRIGHTFVIGGLEFLGIKFDPEKEKAQCRKLQGWLAEMKSKVLALIDQTNPDAIAKGGYYLRALDRQIDVLEKQMRNIDSLSKPIGI